MEAAVSSWEKYGGNSVMSSDPISSSPTVTANFKLKLGEHCLEARIDVPAGPVPQRFSAADLAATGQYGR